MPCAFEVMKSSARLLSLSLAVIAVGSRLAPYVSSSGLTNAWEKMGRGSAPAVHQAAVDTIVHLPLVTNDLVSDPVTQLIYASVPSSVGAGGNSITPINPASSAAGTPVFVGSEPNKMALSDDGK